MKSRFFGRSIFLTLLVMVSLSAKAQLDTAWIESNYQNQYIYPHFMDSTLGVEMRDVSLWNPAIYQTGLACFETRESDSHYPSRFCGFAQRYDVPALDSVKIFGVSVFVSQSNWLSARAADTITIGIWDSTLSSTLFSKTFLSAGIRNGDYSNPTRQPWFVEFLFDDTITLTSTYFVSFEFPSNEMISSMNRTSPALIFNNSYMNVDSVPVGYATKYTPYLKKCSIRDQWQRSDYFCELDYSNCLNHICYPRRVRPDGSIQEPVWVPIGFMPIRVAADTASGDTVSAIVSADLLDKAVGLYPNPAKEVLNIASDYNVLTIAVYDVLNRLVEEREVNSKTLQISLANYTSGSYFAKIRTDKGTLTKKFVVR